MTYPIGSVVRNFGEIAVVVGYHETSNYLILRRLWNDGSKWLADPDKCQPVGEQAEDVIPHSNALVIMT